MCCCPKWCCRIYGAVKRLDPAIVVAAEGSRFFLRIFWRIYLPLTLNGISGAGSVMSAFGCGASFFITPGAAGGRPRHEERRPDRAAVRETLNWPSRRRAFRPVRCRRPWVDALGPALCGARVPSVPL